jgi:Ser/Thr protein kinase RdoA (MazF antagonist)
MEEKHEPYAGLTPDVVLDALESAGLRGDGRLLSLNSYENRVYQVFIEDGPAVVAKFYRPGRWTDDQILEEHAFVAELAANEILVVPAIDLHGRTLNEYNGFRFSVFERCGGRAPELESRDTLEWLGRFIGRIHAAGAVKPYKLRPAIDIASFGTEPRDWLLANDFIPADLLPAWRAAVNQALDGVKRCYDRAGKVKTLRLHGDCHVGNVLWIEQDGPLKGPHFVDFDDSRSGPAIQDLWMLLPSERDRLQTSLIDLLTGYEDFAEFDPRELHLIEALRTLRLIHYSAWIARRWNDPAFPAAFPWFNTQRYWQDRVLELKEQISLMDEAPPVI